MKGTPSAGKWFMVVILLLGFWLRMHRLEYQSMWSDEGLSLYRAQQSLELVWQNVITVDGVETRDTNPPFYFLVLHLWRQVGGDTVFSLRFVGAMAGLLNIPLLYALGKSLWGESAGTGAALLLAISPFHVWESQIIRNYPLLLFFNLLSLYSCWLFVTSHRSRAGICWLVAGLLGIYTHYFGFFVMLFGGMVVSVWGIRQYGKQLWAGRRKWFWLVGGAAAILLLLPVASIALERFRAGQQVDFPDLSLEMFWENLQGAFAVGISPGLTQPAWRTIPIFLLAAIGVWQSWRTNRVATLFGLGYQIIPFALLLGLSTINPLYNGTRHLLIGLPPFLLLLAVGIWQPTAQQPMPTTQPRSKLLAFCTALLGIFTITSQADWLHAQFTAPFLHQDGVKGLANYLNEHAQVDDLVVLHDTLIKFTFDYYYHGAAPVVAIPAYDEFDPPSAIQSLKQAAIGKRLIWFATQPAPRNGFDRTVLTEWADSHWAVVGAEPFTGLWLPAHLVVYQSELVENDLPAHAQPIEQLFGNVLRLRGYEFPSTIQAGEPWWYMLYWEKVGSFEEQLMVIWQLKDDQGEVWAEMSQAITYNLPLRLWETNRLMGIAGTVTPPPDLPAGRYQLWLTVAETTTGAILPLSTGSQQFHLAEITSQAGMCAEQYNQRLVREIGLVTVQLSEGVLRPGHALQVEPSWCVQHVPSQNYGWRLQALDSSGTVIGYADAPLSRADYPPTQWAAGEWVQGKGQLTVPASTPSGNYRLQLSLLNPQTGNPIGRTIALTQTVIVEAWELVTNLPAVPMPLRADFGEPLLAELHGFDLPVETFSGSSVPVTLYWQAQANIAYSYAVLLHLTHQQEEIVAQGDGMPLAGLRPTSSWREGEVLVDTHTLSLPAELPAGSYQLWVGLYDPVTFGRVPAFFNDSRQPQDRILLQTIKIENR